MIIPPPIKTRWIVIKRHVFKDFEPMRSNFCNNKATRLLDMTS